MAQLRALHIFVRFILQNLAIVVVLAGAIFGIYACTTAALGYWPWIDILVSWNGQIIDEAGMVVQIGLTVLATGLVAYLPANRRILQLENSHRKFHVGMQDIVRAYGAVHAADRGDTFELSGEFESVRARLAYLRDHPELSHLEPEVLEVAAQMSFLSKELAETYSDEKVTRARSFLQQRQEEIDRFNIRLDRAKALSAELSVWHNQIELEESVAAAQLERLRESLKDVLPEIGTETVVRIDNTDAEVTALPRAAE